MVRRLAVFVGTTLVTTVIAASPAAASPTQLVVPQSNAFAVLGYSCGGIQEKVYANGFDPTSGYPTGDAYLSTSCSSGGKGGGTSTHAAWASATWDFTGALVSDQKLSAAPNVNPTLVAFDNHGNEVYNQNNNAYLLLAAGFVPAPRVTSVSPTAGPAAGGTSVTITGTGFTAATAVAFGAVPAASFTVTSGTSITAVSPAASPGTVDITVNSAGGTSVTSSSDQFLFVGVPTVTGVNPNQGPVQGGGYVTITGTNFSHATSVMFGGAATAFTITNDTSMSAYVPPSDASDTVDVRVSTLAGTSAPTPADQFTYIAAPSVTGVSPNHGWVLGGTAVTISGAGFSGTTRVAFGGVAASSFTVNSDSSITAISPASSSVKAVDVTVSSADGTSPTTSADSFTYTLTP